MMREKQHQKRQRRLIWLCLAAVLIPLAVLLFLQYRWLLDLEKTSRFARRADLENFLATVIKDVGYTYRIAAEKSLNLSATLLEPQYLLKIEKYFKKKGVGVKQGVRWFFVVNFLENAWGDVFFYDPKTYKAIEMQRGDPEYQAVLMATGPWRYLLRKADGEGTYSIGTEERDPDHRMILNPILEEGQLVGLAGMILDEGYLAEKVIPDAVCKYLGKFSGGEEWVVTVRNERKETVFVSSAVPSLAMDEEIILPFDFVFTDWTIGLRAVNSVEQWAKANFAFNISLSIGLAALLLGGIVLVVRIASREMKLSQMKNDFVSNVSHELRTPLSSIRVFGEFLRLGRVQSEAKIREYGEYIETESRRLTQLINNILDFSRIESGRKMYRFEEVHLDDLLRDVIETFKVRLSHNGFELKLNLPAVPTPEILVDGDAISQALANLIDNAVKYSNGGRRIEVTLYEREETLIIAVEDHGIGIAPDEQQKIFERFHRVGTDLVHDVKGSGLGLAIVHHIVQAHGGEVTVESALGQGSTFSIHLPMAVQAEGMLGLPLEQRSGSPA